VGARNARESARTGQRFSLDPAFLARIIFFQLAERPLLIVRRLFFIHRRNGEVAEWSKALPC
jgi:hypothetical protein